MIGVTTVLVVVLTLNLFWEVQQQRAQVNADLHEQAQMIATQLIAMREFMARNQNKINYDGSGHFEFKGLNPAAVGRGVGELFAEMSDYRFKQTRLHVRNKSNEPDAFEAEVLAQFAANSGLKEYTGRTGAGAEATFRYMVPLYAETSCLQCHGEPQGELDVGGYSKEGLRRGELAGALSISIPMARFDQRLAETSRSRALTIAAFAGLSLGLIGFLTRQLVARPLSILAKVARRIGRGEWQIYEHEVTELRVHQEMDLLVDAMATMSDQLQELYQGLEQKVADRTVQLREANEQLVQAHAELGRLNQNQSEFYSTMTHEFRTPLTSIIGFSQLLLGANGDTLTPDQRDYLSDILESAQRLLQIVNDLLDASRLQAGQLRLRPAPIDLGDVAREVLGAMRPLAQQKKISLQLDLPPDLPLVWADDLRLMQILMNLVSNAAKFTQEGGWVQVQARAAEERVEVVVQDNGPGIAPADQAVIFELFRRAAVHERSGGSGLGLALAKLLVELHGGEISVSSTPGEGASFHFTLPILRGDLP